MPDSLLHFFPIIKCLHSSHCRYPPCAGNQRLFLWLFCLIVLFWLPQRYMRRYETRKNHLTKPFIKAIFNVGGSRSARLRWDLSAYAGCPWSCRAFFIQFLLFEVLLPNAYLLGEITKLPEFCNFLYIQKYLCQEKPYRSFASSLLNV